jgi:presenilin-like A22 family membrane protease
LELWTSLAVEQHARQAFFQCSGGTSIGLLFVFSSNMFAESSLRWVMALLALIGGAKLGVLACYLFDMAMGTKPDINQLRQ